MAVSIFDGVAGVDVYRHPTIAGKKGTTSLLLFDAAGCLLIYECNHKSRRFIFVDGATKRIVQISKAGRFMTTAVMGRCMAMNRAGRVFVAGSGSPCIIPYFFKTPKELSEECIAAAAASVNDE